MRSFLAFCPECKRTQSARFVQTANERKISEATFWLILNTRKNIEAIHSSAQNDKHDHIWTLDEAAREKALDYTRPSMTDCIDDRENLGALENFVRESQTTNTKTTMFRPMPFMSCRCWRTLCDDCGWPAFYATY